MDPLLIVTTVVGLTGTCLKSSIALNSLRPRYQDASHIIDALCSGCTTISATLTEVQTFLLKNPSVQNRSELRSTFDSTLTGCKVVFSCLEKEVEKLSVPEPRFKLPFASKEKSCWNGDTMREYLSQMKGQQAGLALLLQLLKMDSADEISRDILHNKTLLEKNAAAARVLKAHSPGVTIPESIFGNTRGTAESVFRGAPSTIGAAEFAFDDVLVNAKVYRRALLQAQTASRADRNQRSPTTEANVNYLEKGMEGIMHENQPSHRETLWREEEPLPDYTSVDMSAMNGINARLAANDSKEMLPMEISTERLQFKRPFTAEKQISIQFQNPNTFTLAFKVKTTKPKSYCVRPNQGKIEPGQSVWVNFIIKPISEEEAKIVCKDKMLILWDREEVSDKVVWDQKRGRGQKKLWIDYIGDS